MTDPTALPMASAEDRRRYIIMGSILGALQPLFLAVIGVWMRSDITLDTSNPFITGARLGWPFSIPCALTAGGAVAFTHSAYRRFGRDAVLPLILTHVFMTSGVLLFLFLIPT